MMSTDFVLSQKLSARDLFDGRLENSRIREHVTPETNERKRCLTDGRHYLWVYITEDGLVDYLARYAFNAPVEILSAIAEAFDTEIFSEYEPQFWGFNTQEEWDSFEKELSDRARHEFYVNVLAYAGGEPNKIPLCTIEERKAQVAKKLIEKDPALMRPENKERLLIEMESTYDRNDARGEYELDKQEEWDRITRAFYDQDNVWAYVRGEPNDIRPGTIGEIKAQIAKKLVEKDPAFMQPENKEKLLVEMEAIYDRDHVVRVQLGPEDEAFAQMLGTHEDDLPQA